MKRAAGVALAAQAVLMMTSCSSPPAKPLVDGCYYTDGVPMLKVQGDKGTLLAPGNLRYVSVERSAWEGEAWVTFTPAFHLHRSPLGVSLIADLPSIDMMMEHSSGQATISAVSYEGDEVELVQGRAC